ncbi:MAG: hypothetical protein IKQ29_00790 [Bacilli bacterium]|nr:hypothetical protein [Bacilli bacterium]
MAEEGMTFDAGFSFGLNADVELDNALTDLIQNATDYSDAISTLEKYFNDNTLWKGKDAVELRATAIAPNGPLAKLKACKDEITNLKNLAVGIKGAVDNAQETLKTNVKTAMEGGTNNG